jgi:sugar phosphate isomerase/epimerase
MPREAKAENGRRLTRRRFIESSAFAIAAMPLLGSVSQSKVLPIGFSTLGCPNWEWSKILDFAQQHGFAAVELRGLQGNMDLPSRPEFAADRIAQSKKEIAVRGLRISCVDTSANMYETDPQAHEQQLADAGRFIDLAAQLEAPYVRVFGNKLVGGREVAIKNIVQSLRSLGEYSGSKNVTVLIESHGDFTDSTTLRAILERVASPYVALLWDAHHTFVSGKEEPAFTVGQLGKYIRHTHLKDSVRKGPGDEVQYVLTGRGQVPLRDQVEALVKVGYKGYFSFEWEKVWHPELEEPEIAFPDYSRAMGEYLLKAGAGTK